MRVEMYSPDRLYGFVETGSMRVFFHLESFVAGTGQPPPILGEEVQVEYAPNAEGDGRAPRASRVVRVRDAIEVVGVVESFNSDNGWGWVKGDGDHESCYLHRSEIGGVLVLLSGQEVWFYKGHKNGRPRACHVRVGSLRG